MTPNDYQKLALLTENTPELVFSGNMAGNFTGMMRAAIKVGHMQDLIKKHVIYGKPFNDEEFGYTVGALDETSEFVGSDYGNIQLDQLMSRVVHGAVGIVTEAGELQEMVNSCILHGKALDRTNLKEELGDILWYVALAADAGGLSLEEVMQRNIEKLEARYKGKFTSTAALNRDLEAEKLALEGVDTVDIDVNKLTESEQSYFFRKLRGSLNIPPEYLQSPGPVDVVKTIPERVISNVEPRQWDILCEDAPLNWNGTISLGEVSQEIFDLLSGPID